MGVHLLKSQPERSEKRRHVAMNVRNNDDLGVVGGAQIRVWQYEVRLGTQSNAHEQPI